MASVFRTDQGGTALSDMDHDQGVLRPVPAPEALAYFLLRSVVPDVPDDGMCGVVPDQAFRVTEQRHKPRLQAASGHPDLVAGDSAW